MEDLIDIYILYIRSVTEYCSVTFHSSLSVQQSNTLERIQRTVILGDMYLDYNSALEMHQTPKKQKTFPTDYKN